MNIFKRKNQKAAAQGSSEPGLSRHCAACAQSTEFDWAICPNCGALADAPAPDATARVQPPAGAPAEPAGRARFGGSGNFYRQVTPEQAGEAEPTSPSPVHGDRTDPLIDRERVLAATGEDETLYTAPRPVPQSPAGPADRTAILRPEPPAAPANREEAAEATGDQAPAAESTPAAEEAIEQAAEAAQPQQPWAPVAFVVERNGPNAGLAHRLMADTCLGRAEDVDIAFSSGAVSKRHARIRWEDGRFVFWDLASSNFSFLVGADGERERLLEPRVLEDGDTIDLGDARITYLAIETVDPGG